MNSLSGFASLSAEQSKEILVQFEPKRVIALNGCAAYPLNAAAFRLFQGDEQTRAVIRKARHNLLQLEEQRFGALVQFPQAIDDLQIVIAVGVIVGYACAACVHGL